MVYIKAIMGGSMRAAIDSLRTPPCLTQATGDRGVTCPRHGPQIAPFYLSCSCGAHTMFMRNALAPNPRVLRGSPPVHRRSKRSPEKGHKKAR